MSTKKTVAFLAIASAVLLSSQPISAQWATGSGSCYSKNAKLLNLGLTFWPGIAASFEYGVHDAISVGGGTGYRFEPHNNWADHYVPFFARGSFHPFNLNVLADKINVRDKLDVYVGLSLGYAINFETGDFAGSGNGHFISREYIGARYFMADNLALYAEEGSGLGWINLGITLSL